MARSSGKTGTDERKEHFNSAEFTDSRQKFAYRVGQGAATYTLDFRELGAAGTAVQGRRELNYFVGSGSAARTYLIDVDGFLYESPATYYRSSDAWKATPGFTQFNYPYLTRPILPGCLQCHASRIQHIAGTQNAYTPPPFLEGGVACERCHGPGSDHIAAGKPMVNPAKLAPTERDSICGQCHLSGEIRVPKQGAEEPLLHPGNRLSDLMTVFVRSGSASQLRVTSHVENFAQSACKRASGEKMWCGTCHDPHAVPAPAEKASYFRSKCLSCHQSADCTAPQSSRRANGDDCVACHMPHNPTTDVEHVVFTDHSIRKRPVPVSDSPVTAELVPFEGGKPSIRDLGLAYAMVGRREQNTTYLDRAFRLLQDSVTQGAHDPQTLAYLAEFYRDRKDDAHALPMYEEVWRMDRSQYAAAAALGAYRMQRGDLPDAIRLWNQALAISPSLLLVRVNLATALLRTGRADEARAILLKALEFNPSMQEARDLLKRTAR
jgi:tetratricopeptide (TPR) repeat protein